MTKFSFEPFVIWSCLLHHHKIIINLMSFLSWCLFWKESRGSSVLFCFVLNNSSSISKVINIFIYYFICLWYKEVKFRTQFYIINKDHLVLLQRKHITILPGINLNITKLQLSAILHNYHMIVHVIVKIKFNYYSLLEELTHVSPDYFIQ